MIFFPWFIETKHNIRFLHCASLTIYINECRVLVMPAPQSGHATTIVAFFANFSCTMIF